MVIWFYIRKTSGFARGRLTVNVSMTSQKSTHQIQILLIGGDNIQCRMLRRILKGTYYNLIYARTETAALAVLKEQKPDILICDEFISGLNIYEFCRLTKSDPQLKDSVFILITKLSDPEEIIQILESGIDNIIIAPFTEKSVLNQLQTILLNRTQPIAHIPQIELPVFLNNKKYTITTQVTQLKDLLLSVFENIIQQKMKYEEVNKKLLSALEKEKQADKLKDEFISAASHEIRTPLSSIIGALRIVEEYLHDNIPPKMSTYIDIAYRNSQRLMHVINDILDIQKIESGKMDFHFKPIELLPLIEEAIHMTSPYTEKYNIRIRLEKDKSNYIVNIDPDRFIQAITNLLSNACKFSPIKETVRIKFEKRGNWIRISVTDKGPGIPLEFQPRVFERFAQAKPIYMRGKQGTGLGLSITKTIVEELGGKICFKTEIGKGTTFYIDLPLWEV